MQCPAHHRPHSPAEPSFASPLTSPSSLGVKTVLTIHSVQVSVLLEAAIIFIFFPTNVTRVPKIVCRKKKTVTLETEVKGSTPDNAAQTDTAVHFPTCFCQIPKVQRPPLFQNVPCVSHILWPRAWSDLLCPTEAALLSSAASRRPHSSEGTEQQTLLKPPLEVPRLQFASARQDGDKLTELKTESRYKLLEVSLNMPTTAWTGCAHKLNSILGSHCCCLLVTNCMQDPVWTHNKLKPENKPAIQTTQDG